MIMLSVLKIKCEQCGFIVIPDNNSKCPVCGCKIKITEQVG